MINAALAVGNLEETVSVEAAAPIVDVRSAGISEVVENERILELPLQGRQVTDLIVLAGAAVQTLASPPSHHFGGGVRISVAGGQDFGVAYLLDGAIHNDTQSSGGLPLPFPDALQEFRVATSGLSADNGVRSGASVNAVTKSGTNILHGNLFEFYRDKGFNATNQFAPVGPDGKRQDDGLLRHQFGGTLGGPIVQDRLFFFGGYQGTYLRQLPNDNLAFVPTAAMLAGDFTAFASAACNQGRAIALRAPFVNNRVDPALFSPAAMNLAKRLPAASNECGEHRFPTGGPGAERNEGQVVTKVDYQRSANHSLFGRYMVTFHKQGLPVSDNLITMTHQNSVGLDNLATSAAFGDTRVFGSNAVNAFRVTFNRTSVDRFNRPAVEGADLGYQSLQLRTASHEREHHRRIPGGSPERRLRHHQHRDLPGEQRSDAGAGKPSARARRERGVLEHLHRNLRAMRGRVAIQRPGDGPGAGRLPPGKDVQCGAGWARRLGSRPALSGPLCPGRLARDIAVDAQRRSSLGAVLRAAHAGAFRDPRVELGQLPPGCEEHDVRQRAGRFPVCRRRRLSPRFLGDEPAVAQSVAARGRGLGCDGRRPHVGALVVRARV